MALVFNIRTPSLTSWNRMEPRPRSNDFGRSLAAEVRDPAWFLARQWQVGELGGEDAGSAAYLTLQATTGTLDAWSSAGSPVPLDAGMPLERQALGEGFDPDDFTLQVEVGQVVEGLVDESFADATVAATIKRGLRKVRAVQTPTAAEEDPFNPLDAEARRFLTLCAGRAVNGTAVYLAARAAPSPFVVELVVAEPALDPQRAPLGVLLEKVVDWVQKVWGDFDARDPRSWDPARLEYRVQVQGGSPDGAGRVTLDVRPDGDGEIHWSSLDVASTDAAATGPRATETTVLVPANVRFRGMPAPRFWDFESNELALPDVKAETRDTAKLVSLDFMLVHGEDWFLLEREQPVGSLARIDALTVVDVFGVSSQVPLAGPELDLPSSTLDRWSLFRNAQPGSAAGLAQFFAAPPSAGVAIQGTRVLEEVRFGRDETANMIWAVERATSSRVGRARSGSERDAAVEAVAPSAPDASTDTTSPLRYLLETRVPVHYIPFLGVRVSPTSATDLRVELERAANVRRLPSGPGGPPGAFGLVTPVGRLLRPSTLTPPALYRIPDDEVPRVGVSVERVVFRSRWIDGSTHLWIARRKRTGSGEIRSGLAFDQAQPVQAQPVPVAP